MTTPNNFDASAYPPLMTRLKYAIVPVAVLMGGYFAVPYLFAARIESETLAQLPERPATIQDNTELAAVLDQAVDAVQEAPTAERLGHLGMVYQANEYFDEAAACYRRVLELDNTNARWAYLLVSLPVGAGDGEGARALLDRVIALEPTYIPALLRRADGWFAAGEMAEAEAGYLRCLDLDMNNAWARLGLGRIAIEREDWSDAENQLRMALASNRQFAAVYPLLATVCERQGKAAEAQQVREAAAAVEQGPSMPDPWVDSLIQYAYSVEKLVEHGFRMESGGDWDGAQWAFARVLDIDPDNFPANARLGAMLQRQGRLDEAERLLEKALSLPAPGDADHAALNASLGHNHLRRQMPDEAVVYFQTALDLKPDLEAAHQGLAICFLELEQYEAAALHAAAAAEVNPASHEAQYNWGQALMHLGQVDEGVRRFSEAARLNPALPPVPYLVGAYYFRQGNMEKASPYLEEAVVQARSRGDRRLEDQIRAMLGPR